jgi:hypothetical protein
LLGCPTKELAWQQADRNACTVAVIWQPITKPYGRKDFKIARRESVTSKRRTDSRLVKDHGAELANQPLGLQFERMLPGDGIFGPQVERARVKADAEALSKGRFEQIRPNVCASVPRANRKNEVLPTRWQRVSCYESE